MKNKLQPLLLALVLAVVTPAGVMTLRAQDASYPVVDPNESESERDRDRLIYSPGEADANNRVHVVAGKDSITTRPSTTQVKANKTETAKNSAKPSSQEDDSILSFNFLYYLFEKYKLQDIVD